MARQAGIDMDECRLLEENGRAHFMTRRFDREVVGGQTIKHHVQTLCAMDHLDFKQRGTHAYAHRFMVVSRLDLGDAALDQVFRRMAFAYLKSARTQEVVQCHAHRPPAGRRYSAGESRWRAPNSHRPN